MSPEERERYHNRILLCPTDHTVVDKDEASYPVELLHQLKADHELWVQDTLALAAPSLAAQAEQLAYAAIVDAAVELCRLREWSRWTSGALGAIPMWPEELPYAAEEFAKRTISAILPGRYPDLERAIKTLGRAMNEAAIQFLSNAEVNERRKAWVGIRKYKEMRGWDSAIYKDLLGEWNDWVDETHRLVIRATKAANWFADEVRASLNPLFFLAEGRLLVAIGQADLTIVTALVEFTAAEKASMPLAPRVLAEPQDEG